MTAPRWRLHPEHFEESGRLAAALGCSPLIAGVLIRRGVRDPARARAFLDPRPEDLDSPFAVARMERAVRCLFDAVRAEAPIVIYGDYDADGVTATALLVRVLRRARARVDFYVPDRQTEGYGLHASVVERLAAGGAGLIVAVDCGTGAAAAAEAAAQAGLDLVILDHHLPTGPLPAAAVLVNPRVDGTATDYCAAGLAYQACRGLLARLALDDAGLDLIALAALGTVADAVPLLEDNRRIVAEGLRRLAAPATPGLRALLEVAGVQPPLGVRDLSHVLAPRLNAAGRLAHASSAVRLLTSDDPEECRELAVLLDRLNQERRRLCDQVLAEAVDRIERDRLADQPAIVLASEGWHPGVVGIVASHLVERYTRPSVVIALRGKTGKGSARSIPPLHLVEALAAAASHLVGFGGHAAAAGLTVHRDAVGQFAAAFQEAVASRLGPDDFIPTADLDAELGLEALSVDLAAQIERLAPFGAGNPPPMFLTRGLRAVETRLVGGGEHLRLVLSDGARTAEAIAFRQGDRAELLAFTQARVDIAYTVERDRWRDGEGVRLVIEHLWTPEVDLQAVAADTRTVLDRLFARAGDYLDRSRLEVEWSPAFHTKVVGVTFEGRQAILPRVQPGERLRLVRDPTNPHDPHAVRVCRRDGGQLGFLRAPLAARLAPAMDAGGRYVATAVGLTGGGDHAWGLNILIEREEPQSEGEGGAGWRIRPAPPDVASVLTARWLRGRPFSPAQREALDVLLAGGRAAVRLGPGRGLVVACAAAAVGLSARGEGPVAVVLPRAAEVEAWYGLASPWLCGLGLRPALLHGALPVPAAARILNRTQRREIDVIFASVERLCAGGLFPESLVAVMDWLTGEEDLDRLRQAFGDRVRFLAGPVSEPRLRGAASLLGMDGVIGSPPLRTDLRIVDRRGRGEPVHLARAGGRGETVLMVTSGAGAAVEEAGRLRALSPDAADRIAYYHDGLPAVLRRVLEDLYAAGALVAIVAGSLFVHPALPRDVSRVVATGLPPSRLLAADSLGAATASGQGTVVELAYGPAALDAVQAALDALHPSREALVRCYHHLRGIAQDGSWTWLDGPPPCVSEAGLDAGTLASAVEVFLEAGLITSEGDEGAGVRYALADPAKRADLERSLRYREGRRARAAWEDLRAWAEGRPSAILADLVGA
ncbi:MAG: single-stranded-DNA-specific exonuclease RecJ [Armatimonadota bacterium]|nr:single-stranded-DNA-specific exonuclease RecJ [Armatimonadota bacterium]